MIDHVTVVAYGRPATEALAARVAAAKAGGGALAPVTVVVPSNFAGLTARRLLGGGAVGRTTGVANVAFVTALRLLEQLAPRRDRPRLTNPVLGASVRRALAEHAGDLAAVAGHHATEAVVAALYAELSHVSAASLDAIAGHSRLVRQAVSLHRDVTTRLGHVDDEPALARAVVERADLAEAVAVLGHVVWFLPDRLSPSLERLLRAVLALAPSSVVVGSCGDAAADRAVLDTCGRVGVAVPAADLAGVTTPVAQRIVSVTDADEEGRAVLRWVADLADAGVPLDRIGVFAPVRSPYLRMLHQQFDAAGIPANGPSPERLAHSAAGRTILAALALPDERWRRDRVMALVADAPVRAGARAAHPTTWERLTRDAGIVGDDWRRKLDHYERATRRRLEPADGLLGEALHRRLTRVLDEIDELRTFLTDLTAAVQDVTTARTWHDKSAAALALLHHLIGDDRRWQRWEEPEQLAAQQVERAIVRLGALDELDPHPDQRVFRRALLGELDVPRARRRPVGHGVTFGSLATAIGQDLDAVAVVGMAEGQCPAPRVDDALLPDSARARAEPGELVLRADRLEDQHRALLAALAAAPPGRRLMTFPRGDLRGGRHRLPSRWLLDTATALRGEPRPVFSTDFPKLDPRRHDWLEVVPSHAAGRRLAAASPADWDVASVLADRGDPVAHPALDVVARGVGCQLGRAAARFTEWDGNLAGAPVPSPAATGEVLSATRLETSAACGMRYLLSSVLGLDDRDDPERIVELSALDRGSAVHEVLERFVGEAIDAGTVPGPAEPWTAPQRARLVEIAHEVLAALEERGVTGRHVLWRFRRDELLDRVVNFVTADDRFRSARGTRPVVVEMPFGLDGAEPVRIDLGDGRIVQFRGRADRVDAAGDGRHVVIDYKTGRGKKYQDLGADGVLGGRTLQLGIYCEAVLQLRGATGASACYWMVDDGEAPKRPGYDWDDDHRARFLDVVAAIVDGIEAGTFPVVPGEWDAWRGTHDNCVHCPFDRVCPRDRGDHAAAMAALPELAVRDRLAPPEAAP